MWRASRLHWLVRVLALLALAAAARHGVLMAIAMVQRVPFIGDLSWTEGMSVEEAWRVAHGVVLYGDPSLGHVSQQYTPGFPITVGLLGKVLGVDYALARGVSALAFIAMCATVFTVVKRHARSPFTGAVLGAATVAAICSASPATQFTFDVARPDPMALAFTFGACAALAGRSPTMAQHALAGLLATLAVYTKQVAAPFAVWLAIYTFARDRRLGLVFTGVCGATSAAALAALELATHGWFLRWVTLSLHETFDVFKVDSAQTIIVDIAPYVVPLPLVFAFGLGRRWASSASVLWFGALVAAVPASALPFLKVGGGYNNCAWLLVAAPIAAATLVLDWIDRPALTETTVEVRRGTVFALVAAVLTSTAYDASVAFPSDANRAAAGYLDGIIASLGGSVVVPSHPFLAQRRDQMMGQVIIWGYFELDLARADRKQSEGAMRGDLGADLRRLDPRWLVLGDSDLWMLAGTGDAYELRCRIEPIYVPLDYPSLLHLLYRRVPAGTTARDLKPSDVPICPASVQG